MSLSIIYKDMTIDKELIQKLYNQAVENPRKRQSLDLRTEATDPELGHTDNCQRILNALMPGTVVPVHRHPYSNETCLCITGKLVHVLYEEVDETIGFEQGMDAQDVMNGKRFREVARYVLDPCAGNFGCVVPAGVWHTVEVLEPSVIYEAKDGRYGEDGTSRV